MTEILKVITANRLADGTVVYLGPEGRWVEIFREASPFETKVSLGEGLEMAAAAARGNIVLDIVAVDAARSEAGLRPIHIREAIRAAGPTVHRDHGKQASGPRATLSPHD